MLLTITEGCSPGVENKQVLIFRNIKGKGILEGKGINGFQHFQRPEGSLFVGELPLLDDSIFSDGRVLFITIEISPYLNRPFKNTRPYTIVRIHDRIPSKHCAFVLVNGVEWIMAKPVDISGV